MDPRRMILAACLYLVTTALPASAITIFDNELGNVDGGSDSRNLTVTPDDLAGLPNVVGDIDLLVNFAFPTTVAFRPFYDDIGFRLTSPAGTTVSLIEAGDFVRGAADGPSRVNVRITFDQSAVDPVNVIEDLPQTGTFRPSGTTDTDTFASLDEFNGEAILGTWTLTFSDATAGRDSLLYALSQLRVTPAGVPLLGDYNGNGVVDAPDYNVWRDSFGSKDDLRADGNGNGVIEAADYNIWRDNFGNTIELPASVPEPTSLGLLFVTMILPAVQARRG